MNDDDSVLNQNASPAVSTNRIQSQAPRVSVQPVAPAAPIGSVNKEAAPINSTLPELKPAGAEASHDISQELKDIGVVEKKDAPILDNSHKSVGIQHSGTSAPVQTAPTGKVTLPMSEEEVAEQFKTGQDDDSGKWLAGLVKKILAWGLKPR